MTDPFLTKMLELGFIGITLCSVGMYIVKVKAEKHAKRKKDKENEKL